jgi:hypothetical protein
MDVTLDNLKFIGSKKSPVKERHVEFYRSQDGSIVTKWPSTVPKASYIHWFSEEDAKEVLEIVRREPGLLMKEIGKRAEGKFGLFGQALGRFVDSLLLYLEMNQEVRHVRKGRETYWYPVISESDIENFLLKSGVESEIVEEYLSLARESEEGERMMEFYSLLTVKEEEEGIPEAPLRDEEEVDWKEYKTFVVIQGFRTPVRVFAYQRPLFLERSILRQVGLDPDEHSVLVLGYKNWRFSHVVSTPPEFRVRIGEDKKLSEPTVAISELENYGVGWRRQIQKERVKVYVHPRVVEECADNIVSYGTELPKP